MNQYLVAIHYIELIQFELDILNRDPRLLYDMKVDPNIVKNELSELKKSVSKLSDKNLYIEGTIWYQPTLFAIIDQNLGVVDDWLDDLNHFYEISYQTQIFRALQKDRGKSYALLTGLYDRLHLIIKDIEAFRTLEV